jgi:hypothetical protein
MEIVDIAKNGNVASLGLDVSMKTYGAKFKPPY